MLVESLDLKIDFYLTFFRRQMIELENLNDGTKVFRFAYLGLKALLYILMYDHSFIPSTMKLFKADRLSRVE